MNGRRPADRTGLPPEHWLDRPEAGGRFAMWLIRWIGLHCGRQVARLFLYPITLYFYFRRGPERRTAREYFRHLTGKRGSAWQVMRLIHSFGAITLDRLFLLARGTDRFRIRTHGVDELCGHLDRKRGVLLLGAHIGSFDVLRVLATRRPDLQLKVVMDRAKTPALTGFLEALAPGLSETVLDAAGGGMGVVLALSETIREGGMVTLLGDRGRRGELMREVPFLNADAAFPAAPWLIAALLEVPVVLCLGLYRGGNRYDLVFETLAERVTLPRAKRNPALDAYIRRYAARLEHYLRGAPCNWFNFYDFWQSPSVPAERPARDDALERARVA